MNIFVCKKAFLRRLVKKQNVFRDIMKMFCLECSLLFCLQQPLRRTGRQEGCQGMGRFARGAGLPVWHA